LTIGGMSLSDLAAEFGTPLYVFDEFTLRSRARRIVTAMGPRNGPAGCSNSPADSGQ